MIILLSPMFTSVYFPSQVPPEGDLLQGPSGPIESPSNDV